ncbi:hypothetical protein QFZ34_001256 [Phyllobacterium ifriqiyense]|uniref:Uncharacterized protein n=1 Tax=Phyllobacterium ifriqiyense TaxID=314238 RepID=A0ABU0S5P1_9HYPH|nr:hypothetical protein [Phyllobacterium ifriqiyense]MDQ0996079.1 hypothetical protein [Phyllobacterium ifriqiyense]
MSAGTDMHAIITACANSKHHEADFRTKARSLPFGNLSDVSAEWKNRLSLAPKISVAQDLYSGRSFSLAVSAAACVKARLYVVSAGLGFLGSEQPVPAYNLTVSPGSADCVLDHIKPSVSGADWWQTLIDLDDVRATLISTDGLILLAVGLAYLRMLEPILLDLPDETLDRLRIFAGSANTTLPGRLAAQILPYDTRLNGPQSPIRGTMIDFTSRALHHFATTVMTDQPHGGIVSQTKHVERLLMPWSLPNVSSGVRRSDTDIKTLLRQHWDRTGGSTTKLLRVLRDELAVACEQKRFARLAAEVRKEGGLA